MNSIKRLVAGWSSALLSVLWLTLLTTAVELTAGTNRAAGRPMMQVGVCTHFAQGKGELRANLELIATAGVTSLRDEVYWSRVEAERGVLRMPPEWDAYVDAALSRGVEPLLILNYGNRFYDDGNKPQSEEALAAFVRYCAFVAGHFKGRVRLYEIWNEYDIGIGVPNRQRGSADDYVKLLRRTTPALKAVDPELVILGGAMTAEGARGGWLERMLELGALDFCDAVSLHTYIYGRAGRARSPETWAAWMMEIRALVARHAQGREIPLHITEMGWPTHTGERGMSRELSADYLARMFLLARTMPFLHGIWWYDFQDDGWRAEYNEHNFGVVRPDLTPKPAYHALRDVAQLVARAAYLGRLETDDPDLWILRFEREAGRQTWAFWSAGEEDKRVRLTSSGHTPPDRVGLQVVGRGPMDRAWGYRGWAEGQPQYDPQLFSITVGGTPVLLTGDLGNVRPQ